MQNVIRKVKKKTTKKSTTIFQGWKEVCNCSNDSEKMEAEEGICWTLLTGEMFESFDVLPLSSSFKSDGQ